jgi:hypothetical protein
MTLLILAEASDDTAARFAAFAESRGIEAVLASEFGSVEVTITVERDLRHRCVILADGRPVTAILNRGPVGLSSQRSSAMRFAAEERYAALWAALALWPGPVINRPSEYGFPPRLDPLEAAMLSPALQAVGAIANNHEVPGNYAYRVDDWSQLDAATVAPHEVVHVIDLDESRTHRMLVAGTRTFDVSEPGYPLDAARYAVRIQELRRWLESKFVDFAIITMLSSDAPGGALGLLEISPWVHRFQFESVEDAVYSALLERLGW